MASGIYDPFIDGVFTGPELKRQPLTAPEGVEDEVSDGKGLYTRQQLLYQSVGPVNKNVADGTTPDIRRVWPDEPNIGFSEYDMSMLVDAALRIGGPTLKTYVVNKRGNIGLEQETRLTHDVDLQQLRGSENAGTMADVFHQVVAAYQSSDAATGGTFGFDTLDIANTDFYTFSFLVDLPNDSITLRRPGTYKITASLSSDDDSILLYSQASMLLNGSTYRTVTYNRLGVIDAIIEVTETDTDIVQFQLDIGDARKGSSSRETYLSIIKIR